ncbi:hypothetical protein LTR62_004749 [Meristemomyces frigidus]|uniref:Coupling of ubiquitin conjugation to ER degradation protein 1 n=1 Tax=Meristemomyces frigidus TaxID=1508187 RepID=A0AAN7TFY3_9PEZI|nr:hypothetical protein LTR62_004749 [Meristemomyces frigidus]
MAEASKSSINLPQIIAVALVGFFAFRWYMSKPSGDSSGSNPGSTSAAASRRGQAVDLVKVEQLASMFPQLDRRTIAWDLHRNGASVPATTERVLAGRGLETPPVSYQPALPSPETQAPAVGVSAGSSGSGTKRTGLKAGQEDLITRYNLQGRVGGKGKEAVTKEEEQRKMEWSSDKVARAEGLKRRREEMVLAARRRMEEKSRDE